jgi:hypothetical protein
MKGERLTLGGRPTQWSSSHYTAQLDIRAKKNDKNLRDGMNGLTDQGTFNIRILDTFDAILETLTKQGEVQTRNTQALEKLVKLLSPEPQGDYHGSSMDKDGLMYG